MTWLKRIKTCFAAPVVWVLLGAFALRIYAAAMRAVINPDGAQYILQASAIFNGQWSELLDCNLTFVTPLSFLIAAAFALFRDWIVAGHAVNVIFGTATLIPLYYLLKRFSNRTVSTISVLVFALIPVFVDVSSDILRGPIFWFFATMGMLMFVRQYDEAVAPYRFRIDLVLSSLCFMVAAWTRVEGVMFLMVSSIFLFFSALPRKIERICIFISPIACIIAVTLIVVHSSTNEMMTTTRLSQVVAEATQFSANYDLLDETIQSQYGHQPYLYQRFLGRAREVLFLIPVITIFHNILAGVFYPFALVYFVGFVGLWHRYREDHRIRYFLLLSLAGFLALYIHIIQTWVMSPRFLAILMYPGFILIANGIEQIIHFLKNRFRWSNAKAAAALGVFLVIFGLPKSLRPAERGKIVYRQAAQVIEQHKTPNQYTSIFTIQPQRGFEWVLLYAHRKSPVLKCTKSLAINVPHNYQAFKHLLDARKANYFFYEKRYWPKDRFDLMQAPYQQDFRILGQWQRHKDRDFAIFCRLDKVSHKQFRSTGNLPAAFRK